MKLSDTIKVMDKFRSKPSITQTILAILHEIGRGTIESFFPHPYSHLFCNHKKQHSFKPAIKRLRDGGLIAKDNSNIFYLTEKGEKEAFLAFVNAEVLSYRADRDRPRWDGKWRFIFFDIPEKKKAYREYLRTLIKLVGFKEFQKSVWIYPYKIPSFLLDLLQYENILPYTRFVTVANIDRDEDLKKIFSLS